MPSALQAASYRRPRRMGSKVHFTPHARRIAVISASLVRSYTPTIHICCCDAVSALRPAIDRDDTPQGRAAAAKARHHARADEAVHHMRRKSVAPLQQVPPRAVLLCSLPAPRLAGAPEAVRERVAQTRGRGQGRAQAQPDGGRRGGAGARGGLH